MPDTSKQVIKLTTDRTELIDNIISEMEKAVSQAQRALLQTVVIDFVDKLDKDEDGNIKNTTANKQKIALLDRVYNRYIQTEGVNIANVIVSSVSDTLAFNSHYFSTFTPAAQLAPIIEGVRESVSVWLGITATGKLVENGYLSTLLKDATIKNVIRDSVFKSIVSQKGYFEVKRDLGNFIEGNKEEAGALQKYYRNFVFDTFSQVDRTQAKIIADKLNLNKYAIYEGGLIKTSRPFCRARNGKVFTYDEIQAFDPPTAKPPNYNPFTDLGGFSCRHHLNWIPQSVAIALRPNLKDDAGTN